MTKPLARRSFLRSRRNDADATARVAQVGGATLLVMEQFEDKLYSFPYKDIYTGGVLDGIGSNRPMSRDIL